jgi:transposase-like protein
MEKKKRNRYSAGFKEEAVRRMLEGERVKALSLELQVPRSVLFTWREEAERRPGKDYEQETAAGEAALQARIRELEAALGRKTLELDFFQGALRRFAASGAAMGKAGEKPSGLRSAAGWNRKAN